MQQDLFFDAAAQYNFAGALNNLDHVHLAQIETNTDSAHHNRSVLMILLALANQDAQKLQLVEQHIACKLWSENQEHLCYGYDNNKELLLHYAARHGSVLIMQRIFHVLGATYALSVCNSQGYSALNLAIQYRHRQVALYLVEQAKLCDSKILQTLYTVPCMLFKGTVLHFLVYHSLGTMSLI